MKTLIEDSTEENARIFAAVWRSAMSTDKELEELAGVAGKLMKSPDVRELVVAAVKQDILAVLMDGKSRIDNAMQAAITNTTAGIMLGLKYAMYLHEQRELAAIDTHQDEIDDAANNHGVIKINLDI